MVEKDIKNIDSKNTLVKRIGRYAKVSGTLGGIATRMASEKYLGLDFSREDHAKKLMKILGGLKGPMLKVAQLLATVPEALPPEYVLQLQQLQSDAPSMGWGFVKRRMMAELGRDWQSKLKDFERVAAAAASLGQVHKAHTLDGVEVACKLQYPDMIATIETDLNQLKFFFSVFEKYDKAVITDRIYEELSERLYEELDYKREAKNCQVYRYILKDEDNVHVPEVISTLSTDRLLTATWLEGDKIINYFDAPQEQRNELALNMFRAWYVPLYQYGIIHGDPHPGNYTVRPDNTINLLDFGCIRIFPPKFIKGVIDLYQALLTDDNDLAVQAYKSWGFKDINQDLVDVLNTWARFLYGPILEDKVRTIGEITSGGGVYGKETAEKVHEELRKIGKVSIPREFVFMDRAALGLGSMFLHLKAEINWYQLFNELTQDFDIDVLTARQDEVLKRFDIISNNE